MAKCGMGSTDWWVRAAAERMKGAAADAALQDHARALTRALEPARKLGPGYARLVALRVALRGRSRATLGAVALAIRATWCPHRRFSGVSYIAHNGASRRVYGDAFAEEILGEEHESESCCAAYPVTRTVRDWIREREEHWTAELGLDAEEE